MSDKPMALQEVINLFVTDMCEFIVEEGVPKGIIVNGTLIPLRFNTCKLCDKLMASFLPLGLTFCDKCAPKCISCDKPCNNDSIDGECIFCLRSGE